jgi:hypothetical protein
MLRTAGCLLLTVFAGSWLVAGYWPLGYMFLAGFESDRTPDWLWTGAIFVYYIIAPALMLWAAFRLVRPIR